MEMGKFTLAFRHFRKIKNISGKMVSSGAVSIIDTNRVYITK
jgi:hypothetical protein